MIRLIIFDFDGTLADTREIILRTNQETMRRMGYPVLDDKTIMDTVGLPLEECFTTMYPDLSREALSECVRMYREVFESLRGSITPQLFPGVKATLERLHADGFLLSVASSRKSSSLNDFLRVMGVAPLFCYVLGADDVALAKPNPEPVLKTLRDLGVRADETLVVGDMPVDILMGLRAGTRTCGVSYGNSDREALEAAGAHRVIDSFDELLSGITDW